MVIEIAGHKPNIHPSAYVAPNAIVSGDVIVEEGCAVLFGAIITAEGAQIALGPHTVVMENAVLKSSAGKARQFPVSIGGRCIIGPGAYVVGATIESGCFIAAGSKIFNGAYIERDTSVAVGAIVHVNSYVPKGRHIPIQHIAFGNPAEIYEPARAAELRSRMSFFEDVFGLHATDDVRSQAANIYSRFLCKTHAHETIG